MTTDAIARLLAELGFTVTAQDGDAVIATVTDPVRDSVLVMAVLASFGAHLSSINYGKSVSGMFDPLRRSATVAVTGIGDADIVRGATVKKPAANARVGGDNYIHSTFDHAVTACGRAASYVYRTEPGPVDCPECAEWARRIIAAVGATGPEGRMAIAKMAVRRAEYEERMGD